MGALLLSLALAMVIGFAIDRAGLCTVKAVAELLTTGRTYILLAFLKTALWVLAVALALMWLMPGAHTFASGWTLSLTALAGGGLFGLGAAINGGCAFSLLARLGNGQLGMLLALAGFAVGGGGYGVLRAAGAAPPRAPAPTLYAALDGSAVPVFIALAAWAAFEARRLWRARPRGGWRPLLLADAYRLSTAAALLGLANGVLYGLHGTWSYTSTLGDGADAVLGIGPGPSATAWMLFAALLGGVVLSAGLRGTFRPDWRPRRAWARHFAGGLLMGAGAAMAPGGNDVLLFHGIPGLSPHAVPAFAGMIAGIGIVLLAWRRFGGEMPRVSCAGDICAGGAGRFPT